MLINTATEDALAEVQDSKGRRKDDFIDDEELSTSVPISTEEDSESSSVSSESNHASRSESSSDSESGIQSDAIERVVPSAATEPATTGTIDLTGSQSPQQENASFPAIPENRATPSQGPKQLECTICCESKELPTKTLTARCKHSPSVCSDCISTYIQGKITDQHHREILASNAVMDAKNISNMKK